MVQHQRIYTALRWAALTALAVLCALLEEQLFPHLRLFGIAPLLGGSLAAAVAVYTGPFAGALFGFVTGLLRFTSGGGAAYTAAFAFLLGGAATGLLVQTYMRRRLASALVCAMLTNVFHTLLYFVLFVWIPGRAGANALLYTAAPEIVYSTLCVLPLYPIVRAVCLRTRPPAVI